TCTCHPTCSPLISPLFPYTTLFRSSSLLGDFYVRAIGIANLYGQVFESLPMPAKSEIYNDVARTFLRLNCLTSEYSELWKRVTRSEEHTSELQSRFDLVCSLLLEKK